MEIQYVPFFLSLDRPNQKRREHFNQFNELYFFDEPKTLRARTLIDRSAHEKSDFCERDFVARGEYTRMIEGYN